MKSALNWKTTRQTVSRESLIFHFLLSGLTLRQTSPCSNVTLLVFHLPQWKKSCEEEKTVFLWTEQTGWLAKLVCVNGVLWNVSWAYVECKRKEFNIFVFLLLRKDFCKIKQLLTIFCMCICVYIVKSFLCLWPGLLFCFQAEKKSFSKWTQKEVYCVWDQCIDVGVGIACFFSIPGIIWLEQLYHSVFRTGFIYRPIRKITRWLGIDWATSKACKCPPGLHGAGTQHCKSLVFDVITKYTKAHAWISWI